MCTSAVPSSTGNTKGVVCSHCKNDHLGLYLEEHVSAVAQDQYLIIKTRQNVNANLNKLNRLN